MEDKPQTGSAGQDEGASGDHQGDQSGNQPESKPGESVSYETHKRLLGEAKRAKEERDRLKAELEAKAAAEREAEEKRLAENQEYKKLLEIREKELNEAKGRLDNMSRAQQDAKKLDAFLTSLDGKVDRKYWGLIDIDKIAFDPESQQVDEMSVKSLVDEFRKEHGILIDSQGGTSRLPNTAPGGTGGMISYKEWLNLPAKEMKARQNDIDPATLP